MGKYRVLLADDHDVVRKGIRVLLQTDPRWAVCGEARNGMEAVSMAKELKPDIVLMDICMPKLNGLEARREILHNQPEQKVLILTVMDTEQIVRSVLEAGARGYVLKSDAGGDLVAAIDALQRNRTFFTPRVSRMILDGFLSPRQSSLQQQPQVPTLTGRERQIVQLLAEGKSSKELATILNISVNTAETHRTNILRKLKVHSIPQLVICAIQHNIVLLEPLGSTTMFRSRKQRKVQDLRSGEEV